MTQSLTDSIKRDLLRVFGWTALAGTLLFVPRAGTAVEGQRVGVARVSGSGNGELTLFDVGAPNSLVILIDGFGFRSEQEMSMGFAPMRITFIDAFRGGEQTQVTVSGGGRTASLSVSARFSGVNGTIAVSGDGQGQVSTELDPNTVEVHVIAASLAGIAFLAPGFISDTIYDLAINAQNTGGAVDATLARR